MKGSQGRCLERMGAAMKRLTETRQSMPIENNFPINFRKDNKSGDFDSTEANIAVQ
jgi:hypothetical protein